MADLTQVFFEVLFILSEVLLANMIMLIKVDLYSVFQGLKFVLDLRLDLLSEDLLKVKLPSFMNSAFMT
jgi:hypothetical protein